MSNQKINELLNKFIIDPEDFENNFNLATYYESIGQTASALSYYLRSAERTENVLHQYECLIRSSMCFDSQGTRNFTVKGLLQHAISILPKRPEAYYLLSRFYENEDKDGKWNYSFLISSIGEQVADFDSPPLRTQVDYPGKYALLYQKALSAWWCGLCDESRNIFNDLIENYNLDETHKNKVLENLKKFNETNENLHDVYTKTKKDFDWGIFKNDSFMYECFKRDIIENRQYEKFFEVEENDVVLDIGASVGPFVHSILDKNPKLVICLEPHEKLFKTLKSNFNKNQNVICLNKGISTVDGEVIFKTLYDETAEQTSWEKNQIGNGISLKRLVQEYNLEKIDFLKIDCEGGEYDFFTEENFDWIKSNIKKMSGEFHFYRDETRQKFIWFRDNYLTKFENFSIFFVDNDGIFHNITDEVWSDEFFYKYGWVNIYIDNRSNKLDGFPSVHFCTLPESEDRRNNLLKQFAEYNIRPTAHYFEKNQENTLYGLTQSHLIMFHEWYHETNEPYAIFCEDDLSLETVQYWNFTWKEFFKKLPEYWDCVQLSLLCEVDSELNGVQFKPRLFQHWGTQIYLITREYVKKILDRQHYDHESRTFDFIVHGKPFLDPRAENIIYDSGTGGFVYNFPLFVEEIYKFESTFDSSQRPENYCGKNSHDLIINWWKQNGLSTNLDDLMKKKNKVVDFCSFYGPYGSEMLLLRYHVLKGYVDEFVVSESSYSHTGIPVEFECKKKIKEWGLPEEKFKVIELNTPPDEELVIEKIDELNCIDCRTGEAQIDVKSKYARVRDRLSKDALLKVLDDYDDDTVFIHGDIDEIINPSFIPHSIHFVNTFGNCFFYIPLIYLEGRADLRVYNKYWECPQAWDWATFICSKYVLQHTTPVQIRSNKLIPEGIHTFPLSNYWNGEKWTDMGWHFSWMGGKESRLIKKQSWEHRYDSFDWLVTKKYDESDEFLSNEYKEGDIPPCGDVGLILKNYSKENLPEEIFKLPIVEEFLFPESNNYKKETFKNYDSIDWAKYDLDFATKEFAINENFVYKIYTKFFDVEEGDIVFDIGASNGVFAISVLEKNPKEIHCFEPDNMLFKSIQNNLKNEKNVILNYFSIGDYNFDIMGNKQKNTINHVKFKEYVEKNKVNKIDFLKIDCEGGEWDIFTEENFEWISKNIHKISGEFHLFDLPMKNNFIKFRDLYLKNAKDVNAFHIYLHGDYGKDITDLIWDDNYVINDMNYCNISFKFEKNAEEKMSNIFKISDNVKQTCWVVDNFYEDPDAIRKFALEQEYVEGGFGRGFIGRRTEKQFLFPGLKEKFEEIMGMKITNWEEHGMNGRFQNCHSGEPLVYHCDSQRWGGMLYLTPEAPYQCGTTLYAHKKSRARTYYDQGWDDSWKDIPGDSHLDRTPFEPVDVVGNVYNRLMIFDASCIHSASEYFGTVMENSRLWQMFFFDTEGWESPLVF